MAVLRLYIEGGVPDGALAPLHAALHKAAGVAPDGAQLAVHKDASAGDAPCLVQLSLTGVAAGGAVEKVREAIAEALVAEGLVRVDEREKVAWHIELYEASESFLYDKRCQP